MGSRHLFKSLISLDCMPLDSTRVEHIGLFIVYLVYAPIVFPVEQHD